jgi:hypothetical protein
MNEAATTLSPSASEPTQSLREWLGVLVLSTAVLRRHSASLPEKERLAQREIMREAGERLATALALGS